MKKLIVASCFSILLFSSPILADETFKKDSFGSTPTWRSETTVIRQRPFSSTPTYDVERGKSHGVIRKRSFSPTPTYDFETDDKDFFGQSRKDKDFFGQDRTNEDKDFFGQSYDVNEEE